MMIKSFLFLILLTVIHPLMAEYRTIEIRSGAFFPNTERFRKIYGKATAFYGVEVSRSTDSCLDAWASLDFLTKHGRSDGFSDPTRVNIANFSFGLKIPYQFRDRWIGYIGVGPSWSAVWVKNRYRSHHHHGASQVAFGGILKSGLYYFINDCVFIDLFVDYLYQPISFADKSTEVGGLKTGLGLGYRF